MVILMLYVFFVWSFIGATTLTNVALHFGGNLSHSNGAVSEMSVLQEQLLFQALNYVLTDQSGNVPLRVTELPLFTASVQDHILRQNG